MDGCQGLLGWSGELLRLFVFALCVFSPFFCVCVMAFTRSVHPVLGLPLSLTPLTSGLVIIYAFTTALLEVLNKLEDILVNNIFDSVYIY